LAHCPFDKPRLRKLERQRRDPDGIFFLAVGHDESEIETAIAEARATFVLQVGDIVVRLKMRGGEQPKPRWIVNSLLALQGSPGLLTTAEHDALGAESERLYAEHHDGYVGWTHSSDGSYAHLSDEELIARIHGRALA
jgi:hypothetical protein